MAKYVVRYLLDGDNKVPSFIENGGYFPVNEELVGLSVDETKRYLPSSVYKLTKAELIARVEANYKKEDGSANSTEEATIIVNNFLNLIGLPDYV